MLVSLSVKNFKSIREAHIPFGPFTCFIGHNGVGKSNLFDAIHFLSALTERDISAAATEVRRSSDGGYSPLDLVFGRNPDRRIELCADMVAPPQVEDDFGQSATPSTTLLTYRIRLRYQSESDRLLVEHESLTHAKLEDYRKFIGFDSSRDFKKSVAQGVRRGGPLISTRADRIQLHGDGGSRGRPAPVGKSPLTVVGGTNTYDYPTVLAAKREMASWRALHLEPSAMRTHSDDVRDQLALRARVPGVDNWLYGRSLSDGTLRYIALVLMLVDVQDRAVLCIEEPENGIHPSRVPNLAELLRRIPARPRLTSLPRGAICRPLSMRSSPEIRQPRLRFSTGSASSTRISQSWGSTTRSTSMIRSAPTIRCGKSFSTRILPKWRGSSRSTSSCSSSGRSRSRRGQSARFGRSRARGGPSWRTERKRARSLWAVRRSSISSEARRSTPTSVS